MPINMTTKKKLRLPKKYIKHFESYGYDVDLAGFDMGGIDWLAFDHEFFGNTLAAITPNEIVMFRCLIRLIKKADKQPKEVSFLVDQLNRKSGFSTYHSRLNEPPFPVLELRAFYTGPYDPTFFDRFIDNWHIDKTEIIWRNPLYDKFIIQEPGSIGTA